MTLPRCVTTLGAILVASAAAAQTPLGADFTYQGELKQTGSPVNGTADFRFRLYTAAAAGGQIGPEIAQNNISLVGGRFAVPLDFGSAAFGGDQRWLEIDVRSPAGAGAFVMLTPRQRITVAPVARYASQAESASTAGNAAALNGQGGAFYTNAGNLTSGTLPGARLAGTYGNAVSFTNAGSAFAGSGTGLGGLNASNLASGTVADARLSPNVALRNTGNIFTGLVNSFMGRIGVGTGSPSYPIHAVEGASDRAIMAASTLAAGPSYGMYGESASTEGIGVFGRAASPTGNAYGVHGESASTDGRGVFGTATAPSGATYGVRGESISPDGRAVLGWAKAATGPAYGVFGRSESTAGHGVFGWATSVTGPSEGVTGESDSTSGRGVFGFASATTGVTAGVRGICLSPDGRGVFGSADVTTGPAYGVRGESASASGYGVYGLATAAAGSTYGVYGETESTAGRGVFGLASAITGQNWGVQGQSNGSDGRGVFGAAIATTGTTFGVYGLANSTSGRAVYGIATATTGPAYGVRGESASTSGHGLFGQATAITGTTFGVRGDVASPNGYAGYFEGGRNYFQGNVGIGVPAPASSLAVSRAESLNVAIVNPGGTGLGDGAYIETNGADSYTLKLDNNGTGVSRTLLAIAQPGEFAGYFVGNVHIQGTLTGSNKQFKIDHPLDPQNKYLYHNCVESPDMMNIYNGNVTTDLNGYATITLPEWFEALNREFRYQLTVVDEADLNTFVLAKVVRKIAGNRFTIRTNLPHIEVSWMVTGVRHDAWAEANRIPVEEAKEGQEKGKYLHPEVYGKPACESIGRIGEREREEWRQNAAEAQPPAAPPVPRH